MYRIALVLLVVGLLSTTSLTAQEAVTELPVPTDQNSEYNVLVRTDGRTEEQVQADFLAAGVPQDVVEQLNLSIPSVNATPKGAAKLLQDVIFAMLQSAGISTPLSCAGGIRAQANFETYRGAVSSVFRSTTGPLGRGDFCDDFDGICSYAHLAGGSRGTAIFWHEAAGPFIRYITNPGAYCVPG